MTDGEKRMADGAESIQDDNSTTMGRASTMNEGGRQQCVAGEMWMAGDATEMEKWQEEIIQG